MKYFYSYIFFEFYIKNPWLQRITYDRFIKKKLQPKIVALFRKHVRSQKEDDHVISSTQEEYHV